MPSTRYYLEKRRTINGEKNEKNLPIYLYFSFDKKRYQYNTGQKIDSHLWDKKKQRVKGSATGAFEINMMLEMFSERATTFPFFCLNHRLIRMAQIAQI